MEKKFTFNQIRVIGCLIEKQVTTPEYYPLSLNSLTTACNQKSNRDPVISLTENKVERALAELQLMKIVQKISLSHSRAPRYKHLFEDIFPLGIREKVILCELFLRGPQTSGELRTHTERMHSNPSIHDIIKSIDILKDHPEGPYVMRLERQPGQKEFRYIHLFCDVLMEEKKTAVKSEKKDKDSRIDLLEKRMDDVTLEISELKVMVEKLSQLKSE